MHYKDKFSGIQLYGFCNGYFYSDSHDDRTIIASGQDWIVAKTDRGLSDFARFDRPEEMEELIQKWSVEEDF